MSEQREVRGRGRTEGWGTDGAKVEGKERRGPRKASRSMHVAVSYPFRSPVTQSSIFPFFSQETPFFLPSFLRFTVFEGESGNSCLKIICLMLLKEASRRSGTVLQRLWEKISTSNCQLRIFLLKTRGAFWQEFMQIPFRDSETPQVPPETTQLQNFREKTFLAPIFFFFGWL